MKPAVRLMLTCLGIAIGLVFLKEMLGQYGSGGGTGGDAWRQPQAPLPVALAGPSRWNPADSMTVTLRGPAEVGDTLFVADLAIANLSGSTVTDIAMQCDAIGAEGGVTGHAATTVTDTIAPHASRLRARTALHFIHRPGAARCAVTGYSVVR